MLPEDSRISKLIAAYKSIFSPPSPQKFGQIALFSLEGRRSTQNTPFRKRKYPFISPPTPQRNLSPQQHRRQHINPSKTLTNLNNFRLADPKGYFHDSTSKLENIQKMNISTKIDNQNTSAILMVGNTSQNLRESASQETRSKHIQNTQKHASKGFSRIEDAKTIKLKSEKIITTYSKEKQGPVKQMSYPIADGKYNSVIENKLTLKTNSFRKENRNDRALKLSINPSKLQLQRNLKKSSSPIAPRQSRSGHQENLVVLDRILLSQHHSCLNSRLGSTVKLSSQKTTALKFYKIDKDNDEQNDGMVANNNSVSLPKSSSSNSTIYLRKYESRLNQRSIKDLKWETSQDIIRSNRAIPKSMVYSGYNQTPILNCGFQLCGWENEQEESKSW